MSYVLCVVSEEGKEAEEYIVKRRSWFSASSQRAGATSCFLSHGFPSKLARLFCFDLTSMEKRPATLALRDALLENASSSSKRRCLGESSSVCQGFLDFPLIEWDFDDHHDLSQEQIPIFRSLPSPSLYSAMVRSLPFETELSSVAIGNHPVWLASAYALHKYSSSSSSSTIDTSSILHLLREQLRISFPSRK